MDDLFELRDNGTIRIVAADEEMILRRPTNGERRKLRDLVMPITTDELKDTQRLAATLARRQMTKAQRREAGPVEGGELDHEQFYDAQVEREERLLDWWLDEVIPTLCTTDARLGAGDAPAWLSNGATSRDALEHWRSVPRPPGVA